MAFFSALAFSTVFLLPLVFSFASNQIFEVNKFFVFSFFVALSGIFFAFWNEKNKKKGLQNAPHFLFGRWEFLWILMLSVLAGVSCLFAADFSLAFFGGEARHQGGMFWISIFLTVLFFAFWKKSTENFQKIFLIALFSSSILVSIFAVLQHFGEHLFFEELSLGVLEGRSFSTLGQPNFLAQFLLVPIAFSVGMFSFWEKIKIQPVLVFSSSKISAKIFSNIVVFLILALMIFGVFASGSRAGMLGVLTIFFLFATLFLVQFFAKKNPFRIFFGVFVSAFVVFLTGIFWAMQNLPLLQEIFGDRSRSILARFFFWQDGFPLLFSHPFLGLGAEHIGFFYEQIASKEALRLEGFLYVPERLHSFFLDTALSFGIPFALIFFGGIFIIFTQFLRSFVTKNTENTENSLKNAFSGSKNIQKKAPEISQKSFDFSAFAACVSLLVAWSFGFPVTTDFFLFAACLGFLVFPVSPQKQENLSFSLLIKIRHWYEKYGKYGKIFHHQKNSEKIKNFSITIAKIFLFSFSVLVFAFGFKTLSSDIALYDFSTGEKTQKNQEKMLSTPFLEKGFLYALSYSASPAEVEKFLLKLKKKQSFGACLFQLQFAFSTNGNIDEKQADECEKRAGNVVASLFSLADFYAETDQKERHKKMISKAFSQFPSEFFERNTGEEKKFWKDHPDVFEHLVKDFLPLVESEKKAKECEKFAFVRDNFFPAFRQKTVCSVQGT